MTDAPRKAALDAAEQGLDTQWPREIWAAERGEFEPDGRYVTSEFATVPRWEGDRDCEFQRYVDGDIYDSAEKYWQHQIEAIEQSMGDQEGDIAIINDQRLKMRRLLREAADMLAVERDGLAAGISIRGVMSDDPDDQPARDAIAEIDDWTARTAALIAQEGE